jgi:hypothetical protein
MQDLPRHGDPAGLLQGLVILAKFPTGRIPFIEILEFIPGVSQMTIICGSGWGEQIFDV